MTRLALAQHLQGLALRIAAGRPVRVDGALVRVPDRVLLEEELETRDGVTELELEVTWAAGPGDRSASRRRPPGLVPRKKRQ